MPTNTFSRKHSLRSNKDTPSKKSGGKEPADAQDTSKTSKARVDPIPVRNTKSLQSKGAFNSTSSNANKDNQAGDTKNSGPNKSFGSLGSNNHLPFFGRAGSK